jgi:hypothetical protein
VSIVGMLGAAFRLGGAAANAVVRPVAGVARRQVTAAALATLDVVLGSAAAEEAIDRVIASPLARHAVDQALEGPLFDRITNQLLASEELWLIVEEVAQSPAVMDAITHQSVGFADQVAGGMRARSRVADAWLERAAHRALRRPPS